MKATFTLSYLVIT